MSERQTKGNSLKKARKHGYRVRKSTSAGRTVLRRRAQRGRKRLSV